MDTPEMDTPNFDVLVHIQDLGDMHAGPDQYAGTTGKGKWMEAFQITFTPPAKGIGLRYMAHLKGSGDSAWVNDGSLVGKRGDRRPVEGFIIEVTGDLFSEYEIFYKAHLSQTGDTGWVTGGGFCGTRGQARSVEGITVKILARVHNYNTFISKARSGSGKALAITADLKARRGRVSEVDGSDLQVWDKRPVRGGQAFALISKAQPDLCLARGSENNVFLKESKLIDTDDSCVWRNDTVPGEFNAINCLANWELKLNMRGNPPYADKNTDLICYPWARGAANELWRTNKQAYNLLGGFDEFALNGVAKAIYTGCYPKVFKATLPIGKEGIQSVGFDIASIPIFHLQPSQLYLDSVAERANASEENRALALEAAGASFVIMVDLLKLDVQGVLPLLLDGSLELAARLEANPDGSLMVQIIKGKLSIPSHPAMQVILSDVFLQLLIIYLNDQVLKHIKIPAIDLMGIKFAPPVVVTQAPHALVYTSMLPDGVVPAGGRWPQRKVFAGLDEAGLNAVAAGALANVKPSGDWNWGISLGFLCDLKLSAHYDLHFDTPRFTVTPTSGNTYKVRIHIGGYARFSAKCGILHASPGAGANGIVEATAAVSVNNENKIILTFKSLDNISLHWNFDGLPSWMDGIISELLSAFNPIVMAAVTLAMRNKEFELYTIPTIDVDLVGNQFVITLNQLELDSTADSSAKPLLMVTGGVAVRVK